VRSEKGGGRINGGFTTEATKVAKERRKDKGAMARGFSRKGADEGQKAERVDGGFTAKGAKEGKEGGRREETVTGMHATTSPTGCTGGSPSCNGPGIGPATNPS